MCDRTIKNQLMMLAEGINVLKIALSIMKSSKIKKIGTGKMKKKYH